MKQKQAYRQSVEQLLLVYKTSMGDGLSEREARDRLIKNGPNTLPEKPTEPLLFIFFRQFQNPLIYLLLIAAGIIFFIDSEKWDAFIIAGVLFFNAIIGTIQEGRTHTILYSLKRFAHETSVLVRGGKQIVEPNENIVVGDILLLQEGQRVPADARVIESNSMYIDQAVLTGESVRVAKVIDALHQDLMPVDQNNMVFRGTYVVAGSGKAVVVATGVDTEVGKINTLVENVEMIAPLQKELRVLSHWILLFIFGFCVALFAIGFIAGKPTKELLVMLTALFICVVPEGLPVVLSLVLVQGVYRMAKQNVLVKHMQAVEILGRADVIVVDKTGTLTRNEMMVSRVCVDGIVWQVLGEGYHEQGTVSSHGLLWDATPSADTLSKMGIAACLLNTAEITWQAKYKLFDIKGDPTEAALFIFAKKLGLHKEQLEKEYTKIYEIPFNADYKYHAGFYRKNGQVCIFVIGAPEVIIARSNQKAKQHEPCLNVLLEEGLRTVAVAVKYYNEQDVKEGQDVSYYQTLLADELIMLGVCGLQDTIRPGVAGIVAQARHAGLSIIMATGDHAKTALFIAKAAGIFRQGDRVLEGFELDNLSDQKVLALMDGVSVFARVSPEHKLRIIDLFHQKGNLVAMTGDGVNDAPSLVAADLGIAMGLIGTEVAKEAADLILLDDSFESIVHAIEQGRHIFYTLKRVILYFFSTNMAEVLIILFALVSGLPLPITAAQILWLNLVTDGFLDVALSAEPQEPGLLEKRLPTRGRLRLVDGDLVAKMMFAAIPMGIGSIWVFSCYYKQDLVRARTLTLITMALFQWFNAWNCRSSTQSIFKIGLFTNKWLLITTIFVLFLQGALLEVPFMQEAFNTVSITGSQWLLAIAVSSSILVLEELRKLVVRRFL